MPRVKKHSSENPNPIDIHVGTRIRMQRNILGMSQEKLAESLGVTFQQVQKYENGTNRVSASRLHDMSKILGVDISYFFDKITPASAMLRVAEKTTNDELGDILERRETIHLLRAYYAIKDEAVRKKFLDMLKTLATA
ncbi:MAG: helix-turn-helix domain-containing protein [Proteobacteria bacterium]|nr:helix-turn-helix domain-containing protein [Pseudomonadota bacterium]